MFTQRIPLDEDFRFRSVVESHGWYQLLPFNYSQSHGILTRTQCLADGRIVRIHMEQSSNTSRENFLLIQTEGDAFPTDHAEIDGLVRKMLNLNKDLSAFYDLLIDLPEYDWVERVGAGYILRGATVWEDLAKTLLTTNITWRQTVEMCNRLVTLGDKTPFGDYLFPTPQQIARMNIAELTAHVGAGYRGAFLHQLATQITQGEVDVEAWDDPMLDSERVFENVMALKGFGQYAAASIMRLLGHHDRIGLDSVARETYARLYNDGEPVPDSVIHYHYAKYGAWQGLVLWMDVMREDYVGK